MPEGDTIHRLAVQVRDRVGGRRVTHSVFRHPRLATLDLSGRTLVDATSHGKHLFLHFDDDQALHIHLLMDGRVRFGPGGPPAVEEWRRRFELVFDGGTRMTGVDIPLLHLVRRGDADRVVDHLGPDLCAHFGPAELTVALARLESDPTAALGAALLDQRNVAGFGNVYAVEVPFVCGVSPFRAVGEVDGLDRLLAVGAALIRVNAELGRQNTTGRRLHTGDHWVLVERPRACPRCGDPLSQVSGERSPWGRRTVWCPTCQPADGPAVVDGARAHRLLALHPARRLLSFSDDGPGGSGGVTFVGPTDPVVVRARRRRSGR